MKYGSITLPPWALPKLRGLAVEHLEVVNSTTGLTSNEPEKTMIKFRTPVNLYIDGKFVHSQSTHLDLRQSLPPRKIEIETIFRNPIVEIDFEPVTTLKNTLRARRFELEVKPKLFMHTTISIEHDIRLLALAYDANSPRKDIIQKIKTMPISGRPSDTTRLLFQNETSTITGSSRGDTYRNFPRLLDEQLGASELLFRLMTEAVPPMHRQPAEFFSRFFIPLKTFETPEDLIDDIVEYYTNTEVTDLFMNYHELFGQYNHRAIKKAIDTRLEHPIYRTAIDRLIHGLLKNVDFFEFKFNYRSLA